ncbi:hypothetical protein MMC30_003302 [Trapelia coarctata]|nr:hypothetical protein [Trapelia coarctata]
MDSSSPAFARTPTPPVDNCAICQEPLCIPTHDDRSHPSSMIDDDVQLLCNHRFHMNCIIKNELSAPAHPDHCPVCRRPVLDARRKFTVVIRTGGGFARYEDLREDAEREAIRHANLYPRRRDCFIRSMKSEHYEIAEQYLKGVDEGANGAKLDPNVLSREGSTAMHSAASYNRVEGMLLLLRYGADKNFKDSKGKTPSQWADIRGSQAALNLLSQP